MIFVNENESIRDEYTQKHTPSDTSDTTRQSESQQSRSDETELTPASDQSESTDTLEARRPLDPRWPVASEQEARLISHFVNEVSQYFDFCDPRRHFGRVVPQRARSNRTLASAVLALSARHLSRVSAFDALIGKSLPTSQTKYCLVFVNVEGHHLFIHTLTARQLINTTNNVYKT